LRAAVSAKRDVSRSGGRLRTTNWSG
jgi:hypothetical protein